MRTVALIVALLLGIAAAVGVRTYMTRQTRQISEQYKEVEIAVAARHIGAGEALSPDMVTFKPQQTKFLTLEDVTRAQVGSYLKREVTRDIGKGTPLKVSYFLVREKKPASDTLKDGGRAITLAVDMTSGVAGLVRPGDNVDIYATTGTAKGGSRTWLVLSHVNVLAVDDRMSEVPAALGDYRNLRRGYSSFTLAVTPAEAQILVYLQDNAKLTFALRPRTELGQKETVRIVDETNVQDLADQANRKRQQQP